MRRPDPRRLRRTVGWSSALVAVLLVAVAVPGTSSAFTAAITNSTDRAASKGVFTCADTFAGDRRSASAYFEFGLSEPPDDSTAVDSSTASNTGTYRGSHADAATSTRASTSPTACPNDGGSTYLLDGSTSHVTTSRQWAGITGNFSEEAWFKTSSPGKILGFELGSTEDRSSNYDKHLYVGSGGELVYGLYNGTVQTLRSPGSVADGAWHHVVATTSNSGSTLYLDGVQVDANTGFTTAEGFNGYWRIGWGNLDGWPDAPGGSNWFSGSIRFAAAYSYVLTPAEVASAWSIGRPAAAAPAASPSATPTPGATPTPSATTTATPTPAPADTATPTASASPSPAKTEGTPIYQPAPTSSDISTTPDTQ